MTPPAVHVGKLARFPPHPGKHFPPTRNHSRAKEICKHHDEWLLEHWPFPDEAARKELPSRHLGGFFTWCTPAGDYDRMIWASRHGGMFLLTDDYVDEDKMDPARFPGFKQAATGAGPLHPEDKAEVCHSMVFQAIKETADPTTFNQLVRATHEWWDLHLTPPEPFVDIEHYLIRRRVDAGIYYEFAAIRYALNINITDEQLNHPLVKKAEDIVGDHGCLVNDYFSYAKELATTTHNHNSIHLLQEHQKIPYEEALLAVEIIIAQRTTEYITTGKAVFADPVLSRSPDVLHYIAALPYAMGGNMAWHQQTERYNIGKASHIKFPSLKYEIEKLEHLLETHDPASLLHTPGLVH